MSFLWGSSTSQAEFDALLDKTTSDLLPSQTPPDLVASLHLADLIRSSQVPAQPATKALVRRLKHANPNVQILALGVLDICIKNGGTPFLVQVGSREVATELEQLGRSTSGNRDVRERVLAKMQDWATAFAGKDSLRGLELVKVYERMKSDSSIPFPARDPTATAAMVDSLSAPEWTDSPYCTRCRTEFSTFNRKHHCRNCGDVFDQACSSTNAPLPHYGITEPVRVCDGCARKLKDGKGATVALSRSTSVGSGAKTGNRPHMPERSSTVSYSSTGGHRGSKSVGSRAATKEDDDLQRAIEASLRDVNPSSPSGPAFELRKPVAQSGYNPSYASQFGSDTKKAAAPPPAVEEEDDPDLAAAIAASLRDSAPAPSAPGADGPAQTYASLYGRNQSSTANAYPSLTVKTSQSQRYAPARALPSYDLSPVESTALHSFASASLHHAGPRERELYEQARAAAPRLERGLEDAERRREILVEMNAKLGEATRLYQGLLEDGASKRYSRAEYASPSPYNYQPSATPYAQQQQPYAPQPQPQPPYYPAQEQQQQQQHYGVSSQYAYHPPPMGQPLPVSVMSQHQQPTQGPHYQQQAPPQHQHEQPLHEPHQHHQQQQQQHRAAPVPAGIYKPSQFPSVPQAPLLPSVPVEQPWEREREEEREREREREAAPVGELIEL